MVGWWEGTVLCGNARDQNSGLASINPDSLYIKKLIILPDFFHSMNRSPALPMSQIIAHDAPLLSPDADQSSWDALYHDPFSNYCVPSSPSSSDPPTPASRVLRMRMSPDSQLEADSQQLCLPTHQVFPEQVPPEKQERLSISINPAAVAASVASKRTATPPTNVPKKPRASSERVNSKDFIPPDVSGLSKREARLVKNRAAAFLSRQRKREEFELMEVYVILPYRVFLILTLSACYTAVSLNWNKKTHASQP